MQRLRGRESRAGSGGGSGSFTIWRAVPLFFWIAGMEADPTPDEIEQRAAEIRQGWTTRELERRRQTITDGRPFRVDAEVKRQAAAACSRRLAEQRGEQ